MPRPLTERAVRRLSSDRQRPQDRLIACELHAEDLRALHGVREVEIERVWPRSATIALVVPKAKP